MSAQIYLCIYIHIYTHLHMYTHIYIIYIVREREPIYILYAHALLLIGQYLSRNDAIQRFYECFNYLYSHTCLTIFLSLSPVLSLSLCRFLPVYKYTHIYVNTTCSLISILDPSTKAHCGNYTRKPGGVSKRGVRQRHHQLFFMNNNNRVNRMYREFL